MKNIPLYLATLKVGTGKSTLVKYIIDALDLDPNDVCYSAYTGKACMVLKEKGNEPVFTLHKLIYKNMYDPLTDTYYRVPKEELEHNFIIVDECSMVPENMFEDLMRYMGIYVIFLGDPAQIPPIGTKDNFLLREPHVFLDEIMRQALDNEIIKFSMDVRLYNQLPNEYSGKNVRIIPKDQLNDGMLKWADQIICSTNATRVTFNNRMRKILGKSGAPQVGDKLICLTNNWDKFDSDGNPLVNGTIGEVIEIETILKSYPISFTRKKVNYSRKIEVYKVKLSLGDNITIETYIDTKAFHGLEPQLSNQERNKLKKSRYKALVPDDFDYAYAITAWKAQGSQYNKILIYEEDYPQNEDMHKRVMYTAITRATDKEEIVR